MSAFQSLIEGGGECGTTNPVVDLARQLATASQASVISSTALPSQDAFGNGSETTESLLSNVNNSSFNMSNLMREMENEFEKSQGFSQSFGEEASQLMTANEDLWSGAFNDSSNLFAPVSRENNAWANELVANLTSNQEEELELFDKDVKLQASDLGQSLSIERALSGEAFFGNIFANQQPKVDDLQGVPETKESLFLENQFDDVEFWSKLADDWEDKSTSKVPVPTAEEYMAEYQNKLYRPLEELTKEGSSSAYRFQEENVFNREEHHAKADEFDRLMTEGINRLAKGEVAASILLFEAALKIRDNVANAWRMLGIAQAKNENDLQSIAAMKRCLALDGNNLDALMHLGISYTNESNMSLACFALYEYLRKHPKLGEVIAKTTFTPKAVEANPPAPYQGPGPLSKRWSAQSSAKEKNIFADGFFDYVLSCYQNVVEGEEKENADIQCGLGVLLNISGDYQRAVECFRLALAKRPFDHLLWNRLGATLANSGQSDEAIKAYREALTRYPGYIRARYNLGISCILLDAPNEAIQHLLTVLNMQAAGRELIGLAPDNANTISRSQITSNNVWSTLRNAIMMIHRSELYDAINRRDLNKLNEEFLFELPKSDENDKKD